MVKASVAALLIALLACVTTEAKRLIVHLQESPLVETKAFKDFYEEFTMKRSLRGNIGGSERSAPFGELIAKNKELNFQEKRIKLQQEQLIGMLPENWKVAEIARENGRMQKAVTHLASNAIVIDIGGSDVTEAKRALMLMSGVKGVEEEHKIKIDTFQSLDQIGATSAYEALGLSELDIGRGIKIAVVDNGNYVNTSMMNDGGFALPVDIPSDRGEEANINNKLIISRAYGESNHGYQGYGESNHSYQGPGEDNHGIQYGHAHLIPLYI